MKRAVVWVVLFKIPRQTLVAFCFSENKGMAKLTVQTEFGSLYARFRAQVDMDVDPDKPGEIEAKAAELFKRTTVAVQQAVDGYNAEVGCIGT